MLSALGIKGAAGRTAALRVTLGLPGAPQQGLGRNKLHSLCSPCNKAQQKDLQEPHGMQQPENPMGSCTWGVHQHMGMSC